MTLLKEISLPLLSHMASTNTVLPNHLRRKGSASTAGTLGRDVERQTLLRNKLRVKWHIVTLQEASDYVDHDILQERFHVTHCESCAILFNKDTFYADISVKSMYLHDRRRGLQDQVVDGEQGWLLQGVLSRASFRSAAASGQEYFTVLSLHISNIYAKKEGIVKKEAHPHSSCHYDFSRS